MLSDRDRVLWQHFLEAIAKRRPQLEAADVVPMVVVFARLSGRHDDGVTVGLAPEDVVVLSRPDVAPRDAATVLSSAATVALAQLQ